MNDKKIGQRLRELRKSFKLTQEEFSRRIKVHQSTLALFESGERKIKDIYVKVICDEFDASENWLLEGKGSMSRPKKDISLDEYARIHDLSLLEKEILVTYMSIDKQVRTAFVQTFGRVMRENQDNIIRLETYDQPSSDETFFIHEKTDMTEK